MVELIEENEEQEIEVEQENTVIGGTDNYNDLSNKPSINGVQLKGNKTLEELGAQPKGDYAKKSDIPDVSNFITNTTNDLVNYYLKEETYTREEVKALVSAIPKFSIQVVDELPTSEISVTTVYLVPSGDETSNIYTEYIYVNDNWEKLGTQKVDLTDYALKSEIPKNISELNNDSGFLNTETDPTVPNYVKNITEEDIAKWNEGGSGGGATYTAGTNIEITEDNVINNSIPYNRDTTGGYGVVYGKNPTFNGNFYSNSSALGVGDNIGLGQGSVVVGHKSSISSSTYNNIAIGNNAVIANTNNNYNIIIGNRIKHYSSSASPCIIIGSSSSNDYQPDIKANQVMFGTTDKPMNEIVLVSSEGNKILATTDLITALEERVAALEAQIASLTGTE